MLTPRGLVTLTALGALGRNVTLTTDPETYVLDWSKRQAKLTGLGGRVTTQVWGKFARDAVLRYTSGANQWLNLDVVQDMDHNDGLRHETWRLQDFEANDFVVRIERWAPVKARGMPGLYTYGLDLEVLAMTLLRGVTYAGD